MTATRTDRLEDALDRLDRYTYLDAPGFAFHGAMGAETLCARGHDDLVAPWVEAYKARHEPLPAPPADVRIDPRDERVWRSALGDMSRVSDWARMFGEELANADWQDVLRRWVPVLLPGYAGALTHGLIRVGHAVRALTAETSPSPILRTELSRGLALWAAAFQPLPGRPTLRGRRDLTDALAHVPRPATPWSLFEAGSFSRMSELTDFPAAVEALGRTDTIDDALSDLTATFCGVLLAQPDIPVLPLIHTVTPATALRTLQPHLPALSVEVVYAHVWHVNAAITASFTPAHPPIVDVASPAGTVALAPSELLARAADHGDPHVLKFTDACLREHTLRPDPVYLLAAQHVTDQLPAW